MTSVPCLCAARGGEAHLVGCPWAYCQCGQTGGAIAQGRPHRPSCPAIRIYADVESAVYNLTDHLVKVDALLAKNAEARAKMRELRIALVLHAHRGEKAKKEKAAP